MQIQDINQFESDGEIVRVQENVSGIKVAVAGLEVKTAEDQGRATNLLIQIKEAWKIVEDRRKYFTGPLNTIIRAINDAAKRHSEPLEIMERDVKRKLNEYHSRELERQRKEEAERVRREAELEAERRKAEKKGDEKAVERVEKKLDALADKPTTEVKTTVRNSGGTITYKTRWTWKVVDVDKVPRRYLEIDNGGVTRAVNAGERKIPGLEIYEENIVAAR